jgi:WD40 repeat protein
VAGAEGRATADGTGMVLSATSAKARANPGPHFKASRRQHFGEGDTGRMVGVFVQIWSLCCLPLERFPAGPPERKTVEGVSAAAFSPDGNLVLAGFDPFVGGATKWRKEGEILRLWDVRTGKEVRRFAGHRTGTTFVAFLPGGEQAISSGRDGMVRVWNMEDGKEARSFRAYQGPTRAVAVSPDGRRMLAVGYDGVNPGEWNQLRLFDIPRGKVLRSYSRYDNPVDAITFSADGKWALMRCRSYVKEGKVDRTSLRVWDVEKGEPRWSLRGPGPGDTPGAAGGWPAALSPDGKVVLALTACARTRSWGRIMGYENPPL